MYFDYKMPTTAGLSIFVHKYACVNIARLLETLPAKKNINKAIEN